MPRGHTLRSPPEERKFYETAKTSGKHDLIWYVHQHKMLLTFPVGHFSFKFLLFLWYLTKVKSLRRDSVISRFLPHSCVQSSFPSILFLHSYHLSFPSLNTFFPLKYSFSFHSLPLVQSSIVFFPFIQSSLLSHPFPLNTFFPNLTSTISGNFRTGLKIVCKICARSPHGRGPGPA